MTRHDPSSTLQSSIFTKKTSLKLLPTSTWGDFQIPNAKKQGMHFMIIKILKEQLFNQVEVNKPGLYLPCYFAAR